MREPEPEQNHNRIKTEKTGIFGDLLTGNEQTEKTENG